MSRSKKHSHEIHGSSSGKVHYFKVNHCHMCGKQFRSRSHHDALCDTCWADNEMQPYVPHAARHRLLRGV